MWQKFCNRLSLSHYLGARIIPFLLVMLVVLAFYPSVSRLFEHWIRWDEGLAHGLPVVGVFLYLLYESSPWQTTEQPKAAYVFSLVLIFCLSLFWFFAKSINIFILDQLTLVPMLFLLVAACYGWRTSYQLKMLLILPVFAIPVWDSFNDYFVNLSSFVVGAMVQIAGMSAVIDGNSIYIPFGQILIADGCSGVRYLIISLTLGYLVGYLNGYSGFRLLWVMSAALFLGLLTNWVRIFILVVVGFQTKMQSDLLINHEYFGWGVFAAIALPAIYFAPIHQRSAERADSKDLNSINFRVCVLPLALMFVGPLLYFGIDQKVSAVVLKDKLGDAYLSAEIEKMPMPVITPTAQYKEIKRRENVYIQIDQYQRIESTDKLVPTIERLYDNSSWTIQSQDTGLDLGVDAELRVIKNKNTQQNIVQLQWFQLGKSTTNKLTVAKLLQFSAQLHHKNHFMIISLQAKCNEFSCDSAKSQLKLAAQSVIRNLNE